MHQAAFIKMISFHTLKISEKDMIELNDVVYKIALKEIELY